MTTTQDIQNAVNTLNAQQRIMFFSRLGITSVDEITITNVFAAENVLKGMGVDLSSVSIMSQSNSLMTQANQMKSNAQKSWNTNHEILLAASKTENYSKWQAGIFYQKALNDAQVNGDGKLSGNNFQKYLTLTRTAKQADFDFQTALSRERMDVAEMHRADNMYATGVAENFDKKS